jgi:hypothetical protein
MPHDPKDISRLIQLSDAFLNEVLPQAGKLCFQDYGAINELANLLTKLKQQEESTQ